MIVYYYGITEPKIENEQDIPKGFFGWIAHELTVHETLEEYKNKVIELHKKYETFNAAICFLNLKVNISSKIKFYNKNLEEI